MKIVTLTQLPSEPVSGALFTGEVGRSFMFPTGTMSASLIHFSAGSRNKFHTHTSDQVLVITAGTGIVATDAEEVTVNAGDVVLIPAGENHWHGAPGATPMSHITIMEQSSQTTQNEA